MISNLDSIYTFVNDISPKQILYRTSKTVITIKIWFNFPGFRKDFAVCNSDNIPELKSSNFTTKYRFPIFSIHIILAKQAPSATVPMPSGGAAFGGGKKNKKKIGVPSAETARSFNGLETSAGP